MKYIFLFTCLCWAYISLAQDFNIYSSKASVESKAKLSLVRNNESKALLLTVENGDQVRTSFELDSAKLGVYSFFSLKYDSQKYELYDILHCNAEDLDKVFKKSITPSAGIISAIKAQNHTPINVLTHPSENTVGNSYKWIPYILAGVFALLFLISVLNKSKKNPTSLSNIEELKNEEFKNFLQEIKEHFNLNENGTNEIFNALKLQFENQSKIISQLTLANENFKTIQTNAINGSSEDMNYLNNLQAKYVSPIKQYFNTNNISNSLDAQREIIKNYLPLAVHLDSFINYKMKNATDGDLWNVNKILGKALENNILSPTTFDETLVNKSSYVAALIGILKQYNLQELTDVNVQKLIIKA